MRRRCALLSVTRSTAARDAQRRTARPIALPDAQAELVREMRSVAQQKPYYGSRRHTAHLCRAGHRINRKRVRRLMRIHGIVATRPKRRTSLPGKGVEHRVFPYLLDGVVIERVHQVWSTDIPYLLNTEVVDLLIQTKALLINEVTKRFDGLRVQVTGEPPPSGAYSTMRMSTRERYSKFGGTITDCSNSATDDEGWAYPGTTIWYLNYSDRDLAQGVGILDLMATTVAHEIGHLVGLQHVDGDASIMAEDNLVSSDWTTWGKALSSTYGWCPVELVSVDMSDVYNPEFYQNDYHTFACNVGFERGFQMPRRIVSNLKVSATGR